jgi:hypothetical protein
VRGDVWSPSGVAGIFNTVNPSGKILSGRVNGAEKFWVDGSGNVFGAHGDFYCPDYNTGVLGQGHFYGVAAYGNYSAALAMGGYYGRGVEAYGGLEGTGVYAWGGLIGVDAEGGSVGVWGYASDDTGMGVIAAGGDAGVHGSGGNTGVSGEGPTGVLGEGSTTGVYGYGETLAGVYGESAGYGVHGYSSGSYALYAEGDIGYTGSIVQVVPLASNRVVSLSAMQSPENWFEDFGSGQLQNGAAEIVLDPTFAETVNTESAYHVFLTPNGDSQGLYVARKSAAGFEVREQGGGKSDIAFDYRIVARRRGYETVRLRQVEADAEVVTKLRERMAAASSAKSPKLVLHKEMERPKRPEPPKRAARPARPARMMFPQLPNAPGLMNAPQGLNLRAPSN